MFLLLTPNNEVNLYLHYELTTTACICPSKLCCPCWEPTLCSGRLEVGDEIVPLVLLLYPSEHHLCAGDVLLRVQQVLEECVLSPHNTLVDVGLRVRVSWGLTGLSAEQSAQVGTLFVARSSCLETMYIGCNRLWIYWHWVSITSIKNNDQYSSTKVRVQSFVRLTFNSVALSALSLKYLGTFCNVTHTFNQYIMISKMFS